MKTSVKAWAVCLLAGGFALLLGLPVVVGKGVSSTISEDQVLVKATAGGVTFDFSKNPIEGEVRLTSTAPGREPLSTIMPLGKKKVVAASCEGEGTCSVGPSTAPHALKRVVFNDGTSATF